MNKRGTIKSGRPDLETQVITFAHNSTSWNPADSTKYVLHVQAWGSVPGTAFSLMGVSRLNGRIKRIAFAVSTLVTASSEPILLNMEFYSKSPNETGIGSSIMRVAEFSVGVNGMVKPSSIECDIPIKKGQLFSPSILTPVFATNPTQFAFTCYVYIEGISDRNPAKKNSGAGLFNADLIFPCAANSPMLANTRYYWLLPQTNTSLSTVSANAACHISPYTGYIEAATVYLIDGSGTLGTDKAPVKIGVEFRDRLNSVTLRDVPVTTMNWGIGAVRSSLIFDCKIPIKKGDRFRGYIQPGGWAVPPTSPRPTVIFHIRGK